MLLHIMATIALTQSTINIETSTPQWNNEEVTAYLNKYGPDRHVSDQKITSPLVRIFLRYKININSYNTNSGFERFRRIVGGVSINDYLTLPSETRIEIFEDDVATESLRQIVDSRALTNDMVEFVNENYGEERTTAKQTVDALIVMHRQLTEPEDPFSTPPVPAEHVKLTFPVLAAGKSQSTYWSYDINARTMTIVASEDANTAAGDTPVSKSPSQATLTMRGWAIEEVQNGPPTTYSVDGRQVSVPTNYVMGFGQVQQSARGGRPTSGTASQGRQARVFSHTFSIEPEPARALSQTLELQVFGKAQPWSDDQRTFCVTSDHVGEQPITRVRSCFLTGVLETYRIVDNRDGSVIHEWDAR